MLLQVAILLGSMIALYFGAELALDAAEKIGKFFGLSPLVIGLLLIGFGTSLPEFFVSQLASYNGHPEMALGNIVGSNIANLYLIMGVSSLFVTLHIIRTEIRHQLILHIGLTGILCGVLYYGKLNWMTSAVLFSFFSFYIWETFREMKKQRRLRTPQTEEELEEVEELTAMVFVKLIFGFGFLYLGGEYLVSSGSSIATRIGVSEYVISAIFVAFGTSFPELVTAMIACYKKKNTDLITGNIIGSNIFNVALVMGSLGIYDITIEKNFNIEISALIGTALFLTGLSYLKKNFSWPGGVLFLGAYGTIIYSWIS